MLRLSDGFDWKTNCFMCSKQTIINARHKDGNHAIEVRELQIRANALQKYNKRNNEFARPLQGRLQTCLDLVAEEAVYHSACYQKFLPNEDESNPVGRPFNADSNNAFNKFCLWLESEAGTYLLRFDELQEKNGKVPNQMKHIQPSGYKRN